MHEEILLKPEETIPSVAESLRFAAMQELYPNRTISNYSGLTPAQQQGWEKVARSLLVERSRLEKIEALAWRIVAVATDTGKTFPDVMEYLGRAVHALVRHLKPEGKP